MAFDRFGSGSSGPRQLFDVTCSECGKTTQVPFQPDGKRPVYCRDCYQKHKPARNDRF
jgi:CxxC-x17-CxxC domain-containing protein